MSTPKTPSSTPLTMNSSIVIFCLLRYSRYEYAQHPGSSRGREMTGTSTEAPAEAKPAATEPTDAKPVLFRKSRRFKRAFMTIFLRLRKEDGREALCAALSPATDSGPLARGKSRVP